jgi:hypothetical protein
MSSRITQFFRTYLADQGSLSLPGFGVILFDGSSADEGPSDVGDGFPPGSLSFRPDVGGAWDEDLIQRIAAETGKMRTLVVSDLDSYLQFGHELTNISKPFHIEGIGWVQKDHRNEVSFMQEDSPSVSSASRNRKSVSKAARSGSPIPWRTIAIGAGLAVLAMVAYWVASRLDVSGSFTKWRASRRASDSAEATPAPSADTAKLAKTAPSTTPSVNYPFSVVLEISSRERALKRYADLKEWGHNIRMATKDSVRFKLYIPIQAPLSDTARHRDSLRIFFNRRVWIETHPDE